VVVISDGPAAIRSGSSDGLTWTIDGNANGASQLKVGSVMLATSRVAGRVAALRDDGGNRIVTLAPVDLTDIIRDGDIEIDKSLDASSFVYQEVPDLPGKVSEPPAQDTPATVRSASDVVLPPVRLIATSGLPLPSRGVRRWRSATTGASNRRLRRANWGSRSRTRRRTDSRCLAGSCSPPKTCT
jgi:hypothetical protein